MGFNQNVRFGITLLLAVLSKNVFSEAPASRVEADLAAYERRCERSGSLAFLGPEQTWSATAPQRSLQDLGNFVQSNRITSPAALVTAFRGAAQNAWPTNSFLMSHSESGQADNIDGNNPRVLLYGNGLILGATGHSNPENSADRAQNNNRIEVIRYDEAERRYQFGLLDFNRTPPTLEEPTTCFRCHGTPPRPIWQPLQFWDHLTRVNQRTPFTPRPNSIYSTLGNTSRDKWTEALNFTSYLDHLNFRHTAASLRASNNYARYRYATLAALMRCEDIPSFVGNEAQTMIRTAGTLAGLQANTEEVISINNRLAVRFGESNGFAHLRGRITTSSLQTADIDSIAALRFLYEGRGISLRQLSSRRARNVPGEERVGYGFLSSGVTPQLGAPEIICHLLPNAIREDPRLFELLVRQTNSLGASGSAKDCDLLKRLSLEAIGGAGNQRRGATDTPRVHERD